VALVLGAVGLGLVLLLLGPVAWLLAGDTVGGLDAGKGKADAINAVRGVLLQAAGGLVAVGVLWFTARTYVLSREGQVTDRYTKAVDQIGAGAGASPGEGMDQRIGGVFALERIMRDSKKDHAALVDVLTAFIRVHAPRNDADERRPGQEVRAALTVLGRRPPRRERELHAMRLGKVNLQHTMLRRGRMDCVRLRDANLAKAHWEHAQLKGAKLDRAILNDIDLEDADLRFASLPGANLRGAKLNKANLAGADLEHADLVGAKLIDTHLAGVTGHPRLTDAQRAQAHCLPETATCPDAGPALAQDPCGDYEL
jgi:hypothetical protein